MFVCVCAGVLNREGGGECSWWFSDTINKTAAVHTDTGSDRGSHLRVCNFWSHALHITVITKWGFQNEVYDGVDCW